MNRPVKLFIVEGADRDYRFITRMTETFFSGKYEAKVICLPAQRNIYMLYRILKDDNFETDFVELIRDNIPDAEGVLANIERQSIDEIFLFFDYDVHQENLPKGSDSVAVLQEMLDTFNNETENGKLYISYPMIEAIYDYRKGECQSFSICFVGLQEMRNYKKLAGEGNPNANRNLRIEDWKAILAAFYLRIKCLFDRENLDYKWYKENATVDRIHSAQREFFDDGKGVFVLSALPEFLFDYFKVPFWNSHTHGKKRKFECCEK